MKYSYLIQRLCPPRRGSGDNPFTFGGGLLRGGLSKEAMDLLEPIWSFDYMGSAEFEFGSVPKALEFIVNSFVNNKGCTGEIKVKGKPIFYICNSEIEDYVRDIIPKMYSPHKYNLRFKENPRFSEVINGETDRYIGWLELDNGFLFFADQSAFEKFKSLLS